MVDRVDAYVDSGDAREAKNARGEEEEYVGLKDANISAVSGNSIWMRSCISFTNSWIVCRTSVSSAARCAF